jgi:protease-4
VLHRLLALLVLSAALTACGPLTFTIGSSPLDEPIEHTLVEKDTADSGNHVALIDVSGLIYNGNSRGFLSEGENPVGLLHEKLEKARHDATVKAVILRLNTPGGTVTASDAMYREVMRFKSLAKKPVVVLMMDVAASGGYYISCAADKIVAYPSTITGSIGVIFQTISVKPALERWGIKPEAIVSGPNKETASPLTEMTESQRQVLRALVDDFYARFTTLVREKRPNIPADEFAKVTDGRVVSGSAALKLGLVDEVGDLYDAWATAKRMANVKHADLIIYHRASQVARTAYATAPAQPMTQINLAQFNLDATQVGDATMSFLYIWKPSLGE